MKENTSKETTYKEILWIFIKKILRELFACNKFLSVTMDLSKVLSRVSELDNCFYWLNCFYLRFPCLCFLFIALHYFYFHRRSTCSFLSTFKTLVFSCFFQVFVITRYILLFPYSIVKQDANMKLWNFFMIFLRPCIWRSQIHFPNQMGIRRNYFFKVLVFLWRSLKTLVLKLNR